MAVEVPASFLDITATWFDAALAEGGWLGGRVASIVVHELPPDAGLIGDLARVVATFEGEPLPTDFIMKLPAANPSSRQIGEMLGAYQREVAFYRHVAPSMTNVSVPRCFYAGEDLEARRWAIVLEAFDHDIVPPDEGVSVAQATRAVETLADLHASWWTATTPFAWMPGFDTTGVAGLQPLWLQNLPAFVERYGHVLPGDTADRVLAFAHRLGEWSDRAAREPLTMVHSDFRLDNLLFVEDRVVVIDWQTAMRAPAAMDLSCFLTTSLTIEARRSHERALIDQYLHRLAGHGVTIDHEWFFRSYDENLLWWMGQFGNNLAHLDPADDRTQAALTTMVERVYTAGLDHG